VLDEWTEMVGSFIDPIVEHVPPCLNDMLFNTELDCKLRWKVRWPIEKLQ
jgi:hypothetical protein